MPELGVVARNYVGYRWACFLDSISMRQLHLLLSSVLLALAGCISTPGIADERDAGPAPVTATPTHLESGFVQVRGTRFVLDGKTYRFAGANFWYGAYLGAANVTGDRARLRAELDQLHAAGVLGPPDGSKPRDVLMGLEDLDRISGGRG